MQHIYDTATSTILWTGPTYLVDGAPGIVEPPLALLDAIIPPAPAYDPATQELTSQTTADLAAGEMRTTWTVRDLTEEEIRQRISPVTPRQFRLALLAANIDPADIDTLLAGDPAALTEWQYAQEIRRDHPLVESLSASLQKTPEQVDALFLAAAIL